MRNILVNKFWWPSCKYIYPRLEIFKDNYSFADNILFQSVKNNTTAILKTIEVKYNQIRK